MRYHYSLLLLLVTASIPSAALADAPDPAKLAEATDALLAVRWQKAGVRPAPVVDDAAFLRRASLDLIGRIPTVAETRAFLEEKSSEKRAKLVNRMIDSGGHTRHMATFWRRTWVPQADTAEFARLAYDFEAWIAGRLQKNVPYDRIVRELLTVPMSGDFPTSATGGGLSPVSFFSANENKPENLAASASRAFLGVNLDCAQCHNHPFARWTRDQFWQTAAFFAAPGKDGGGALIPAQLTIPSTSRALAPKLIDGKSLTWPAAIAPDTGRRLLTSWVVAGDNPYFARNAVNRLWAQMFGTALVEPLDDLSGDAGSQGPNVDLLKQLAEAFVAGGYDLKYMTRALAMSKAYQLSSVLPDGVSVESALFARMPVRGLTGEQLYDSLRTAAGLPPERDDTGNGPRLDARRQFAAQFRIERSVAAERSIVQALSLMNGRLTAELTDPAKNLTLASVSDAPFLDTRGKVETLFMAVLSRRPTQTQAAAAMKHVEGGGAENDPRRALADVFWALVNTTEFNTNH